MPISIIIQNNDSYFKVGVAGEHHHRANITKHHILCHAASLTKEEMNEVIIFYIEIFTLIFIDNICVKPKDCNVVFIENVFLSKCIRDIVLSVLIHHFQVLEVSIQPDLFLPILTSVNSSGVVIHLSSSDTKVIAIYQGRPILQTLKCSSNNNNSIMNLYSQ